MGTIPERQQAEEAKAKEDDEKAQLKAKHKAKEEHLMTFHSRTKYGREF